MLIGVGAIAISLVFALSSDPPYATPTPFVAAEDVIFTGQKPDDGPGALPYFVVGCVFLAVGTVLLRKKRSSGHFTIGPKGIRVQDSASFDFQWSQVRRVTIGKGPRISASDALRGQGKVSRGTNLAAAQGAIYLSKKAEDSWWFDFEVEPQGTAYLIFGSFFAKSQHREVQHWIRKSVQSNLRPEQIVKDKSA
jgi:hypothetical protein